MVHERLRIVMNVLVRHRQFFLSGGLHEQLHGPRAGLASRVRTRVSKDSDPTHEPWPRADASDGSYSTAG